MKVFNMFITAVCVIFLIKLRWPKTKSLYNGNVVQKLAPFCIPCRVVASFLHGLLLNDLVVLDR